MKPTDLDVIYVYALMLSFKQFTNLYNEQGICISCSPHLLISFLAFHFFSLSYLLELLVLNIYKLSH